MKRYLIAVVALALLGMSQNTDAMFGWGKKEAPSQTATKSGGKSDFRGRHRMTKEERIARGEKTVASKAAIVKELERSGFAKKNPEAFAVAQKTLARSENYLKNVKAGKRYGHHRRGHYAKRSHQGEKRGHGKTARA